jgi:uncharacterized repeat protein (TIGR03803 family)
MNTIREGWAGAAIVTLTMALLVTPCMHGQTYKVLHQFTQTTDGEQPFASLLLYQGSLYGTTLRGGASGCGTIFKFDLQTRQETVLHSFVSSDGCSPLANLVNDSAGNLYGTTAYGGASNNGAIFRFDSLGTLTVLYSFTGGVDGEYPGAAVVLDSAGNIYGTTSLDGLGSGTVFELDSAGNFATLHSFAGGNDGSAPSGPLLLEKGHLYGLTRYGGGSAACGGGCGTLFQVNLATGQESVLYRFTRGDGSYPVAGLISDHNGNLYGVTETGGSKGFGTVFQFDIQAGQLTSLHSLVHADGFNPMGTLARDSQGNLYGTTYGGGRHGYGTAFVLDLAGTLTVLHAFRGRPGSEPKAGLVLDSRGDLYGTTTGFSSTGSGLVFEIKP